MSNSDNLGEADEKLPAAEARDEAQPQSESNAGAGADAGAGAGATSSFFSSSFFATRGLPTALGFAVVLSTGFGLRTGFASALKNATHFSSCLT